MLTGIIDDLVESPWLVGLILGHISTTKNIYSINLGDRGSVRLMAEDWAGSGWIPRITPA